MCACPKKGAVNTTYDNKMYHFNMCSKSIGNEGIKLILTGGGCFLDLSNIRSIVILQ